MKQDASLYTKYSKKNGKNVKKGEKTVPHPVCWKSWNIGLRVGGMNF